MPNTKHEDRGVGIVPSHMTSVQGATSELARHGRDWRRIAGKRTDQLLGFSLSRLAESVDKRAR